MNYINLIDVMKYLRIHKILDESTPQIKLKSRL